MEGLLNELENAIDSYKLKISESGDVKMELSDCDVLETEDPGNYEEDINTRTDETWDGEESKNKTEEVDFSSYRTFSCTECSLKTNSQEILLLHMKHNKHINWRGDQNVGASKMPKVKVKAISNSCRVCEAEFLSGLALREHLKREHPGTKVFYCSKENCDYGTNYTGNLRMHLEGFHNQAASFKCDLCQYKTKWKPTLLEHKRHKHGLFERKSKYFQNTKAREPTKCPQCEHVASSQKFLVIHIRNKHREINANVKCDQCSFVTYTQLGLILHKRWTHSGKIRKNFNCKKCEFTVTNRFELKAHKREVHGVHTGSRTWTKGSVKILQCKLCPEKLRGKDNYRKHKTEVHAIPLKTHKCWFCDFKTTSGLELSKHKADQHPGAEYKCPQCSFVTKKRNYVLKHIDLIHSSKDWLCDQCEKVCKNEHYLKIHKKRYHEERKHKCDKCKFAAIYQSVLKNHIEKCHNPEKSIKAEPKVKHEGDIMKCEVENCTFGTSSKRYMIRHITRKHPEKSLEAESKVKHEGDIMKCEVENCSYETSAKRYLTQHIRKVHQAKEEMKVEKQEIKEEMSEQDGLKVESQAEQKRFECLKENCLYKTTKERYLKDHNKRKHAD